MDEANADTGLDIDKLRDHVDGCALTFRWLWTTNLLAALAGIALHRYELSGIAGATSLVALVGAGVARGAKGTLGNATTQRRDDVR